MFHALEPHSLGVYVNFTSDDANERVRQAYNENQWARLTALKAKYDPTNFFRMNANIPPREPESSAASLARAPVTSRPSTRSASPPKPE
jgi:hypothetical protein